MPYKSSFVNEVGNSIQLTVSATASTVVVHMVGPTSECHHTYTKEEALELLNGLVAVTAVTAVTAMTAQ